MYNITKKTHNNLNLEKLKNLEFQIQETVNDKECVLEDDNLNNQIIKKIKDDEKTILKNKKKAMLTQISNENNDYYEQYTIYPLYEMRRLVYEIRSPGRRSREGDMQFMKDAVAYVNKSNGIQILLISDIHRSKYFWAPGADSALR